MITALTQHWSYHVPCDISQLTEATSAIQYVDSAGGHGTWSAVTGSVRYCSDFATSTYIIVS